MTSEERTKLKSAMTLINEVLANYGDIPIRLVAMGQETAKESNTTICQCCGNRNRPVMDSGYCVICEKDATPEEYSVKRKFCGDCSQQLPGFYPLDDTETKICDRCLERRR